MTLLQGSHNKDPSTMILRQELLVMQVNMTPLIKPQDKKMSVFTPHIQALRIRCLKGVKSLHQAQMVTKSPIPNVVKHIAM